MAEIPQNFLFRFRFPVEKAPKEAFRGQLRPEALDASFGVPFWSRHQPPDGFEKRVGEPGLLTPRGPENRDIFDFRFGWASEGILFTIVVAKKKNQRPFWRRGELRSADCVRLCLDCRDVKDARRANKYCHKFVFYPFVGESPNAIEPGAQWVPIERAKSTPNSVDVADFKLSAEKRPDGYAFSAFIPGSSLTGYDAYDMRRIGIHYVVRDSYHGGFVLQYAEPTPCEDDPSLCATFAFK